jgi:N-terminal domain of ribose phosphate pyrophosphokinase
LVGERLSNTINGLLCKENRRSGGNSCISRAKSRSRADGRTGSSFAITRLGRLRLCPELLDLLRRPLALRLGHFARRHRQRLILANFCGSRTPPCSRSDRFCYKNGPFHSGDAFALAASAPYRDLYYASVTIPMGLRSLTEIAVFSGSAHPLLAAEICSHLDVPLLPSQVERYANDCLGVQLQANCRQRDVFIIQPLVPPVQEHLVELLLMLDAARGHRRRARRS